MTDEEIKEKVENNKCPTWDSFCTVATTGYPDERRTAICTECWETYLKEEQSRKRSEDRV